MTPPITHDAASGRITVSARFATWAAIVFSLVGGGAYFKMGHTMGADRWTGTQQAAYAKEKEARDDKQDEVVGVIKEDIAEIKANLQWLVKAKQAKIGYPFYGQRGNIPKTNLGQNP